MLRRKEKKKKQDVKMRLMRERESLRSP